MLYNNWEKKMLGIRPNGSALPAGGASPNGPRMVYTTPHLFLLYVPGGEIQGGCHTHINENCAGSPGVLADGS